MKIILKNNSDFPIYEQIKQQVKQNILKGHVAPGEHLPSMREQFFTIENLVKELVNEAQAIEMSLEELQDILTFIYEEESS